MSSSEIDLRKGDGIYTILLDDVRVVRIDVYELMGAMLQEGIDPAVMSDMQKAKEIFSPLVKTIRMALKSCGDGRIDLTDLEVFSIGMRVMERMERSGNA